MTKLKRIPYEANEHELALLDFIKQHLQSAFGKHQKVTNADAVTYSLLIAHEILDEAATYTEAMPYEYNVQHTRLARFLDLPDAANQDLYEEQLTLEGF
jgi:hypothetical protein